MMTKVSTPDDVRDKSLIAAWPTDNYGTAPGRGDASGVDPLSCEGPHRSVWRLTGYQSIGTTLDGTVVYVLRVSVNDTSRRRFLAASLSPTGGITMHAYDYQDADEQTLAGATQRAQSIIGDPGERTRTPVTK